MYIRANPDLDKHAVRRVIAAAVDQTDDHVDDSLALVGRDKTASPLDEPANVAARMAGAGLAARSALERCAVDSAMPVGQRLGEAALGRSAMFDERESRRLARGVYEGVAISAERAEAVFDKFAGRRPVPDLVIEPKGSGELEVSPDVLARLYALRKGDNIGDVLDLETLKNACAEGVVHPPAVVKAVDVRPQTIPPEFKMDQVPQPDRAAGTALGTSLAGLIVPTASDVAEAGKWTLENADLPFSGLWEEFAQYKVAQGDWHVEEQVSARSTLRLVIDVVGDKPARAYTPQDMAAVRSIYRALPNKYAQANPWKDIYEREGATAVAQASAGMAIERTSKKSWDKQYSRISGLFHYAQSSQGSALPRNAENPCDGLFLRLRKEKKLTPAQRNDLRREWALSEIALIFNAFKFVGAASASRWKKPGDLVVRDHRYWLVIIAALHGNRREEPVVLKVKHVRCCPLTKIWYFDLEAPELRDLLKADGSPRLIPLHWVLIALGFLEARVHGRDPEERLFSDAETAAAIAGDASPFGQWFRLFRHSIGITDPTADSMPFARQSPISLMRRACPSRMLKLFAATRATEGDLRLIPTGALRSSDS